MTRSVKWLLAGLALSVAINLVLAGFLAGRWLQGAGLPPGHDPALLLWPAVKALPSAERETLRPLLRESLRASKRQIRSIRRAQRSVQDALRAEPFDSAELAQALSHLRGALNDSQAARHATLVSVAERLPREQRRRLAIDIGRHRLPPGGPAGPEAPPGRLLGPDGPEGAP